LDNGIIPKFSKKAKNSTPCKVIGKNIELINKYRIGPRFVEREFCGEISLLIGLVGRGLLRFKK